MTKVAPSILSADFVNLARDIAPMAAAGADYVHVDVMDGCFVPNITIGMPVVAAIHRVSPLPLDVHLMIERPIRYAARFCEAGASVLSFHIEADSVAQNLACLRLIRDAGVRPAIAVRPATPAEVVRPYLSLCELILVMTVEPGFGGQSFRADMMPKLAQIRHMIDYENPACELEVDGGIRPQTAALCCANGANVLVTGSAYFHAPDPAAFVAALKRA